jgi:hypothetical protein
MRFIQSLPKIDIDGLGKGVVKPPSPTLPPKGEGSVSFVGVEYFQPLQGDFQPLQKVGEFSLPM